MADVENETAAPEGAEESQPEVTNDEETKVEATEAENEGQAEPETAEKPESPVAKDDEEKVDEPQEETSGEKPVTEDAEEVAKTDGDEEKPADGDVTEQAEASGDKPEGEETSAVAEDNAEAPGEAEENAEAVEATGETGTTEDAEATGESAPDAEAAEVAADSGETEAPTEPADGAEAMESSVSPKEDETQEQTGEGGEDAAEAGATTEEGESKPEGEAEEQTGEEGEEGEKGEEVVAEEGDREASPVGEKLSRGPTPDAIEAVDVEHERLEATTPDRIDEAAEGDYELREEDEERMEDEEEEEEDDEDEPAFRREELIEKYHEALADREQLQQQNYALQHKLAEYFRKKKADERQDYDKNVTDQEQRYLKYMAQLEDLRRQDMMEKDNFRAQIEDAKERCQDKKEKVDFERKKFMEFKKQVALNAVNSRSGKPIPPKDIEQYLVNEVKKEQEVVNVRLENIKLKNKLKKKEQQLKSKEELAEGLHLIDFEQLKIENQTYNEKIEERNEELLKLRKKITSTVQVLTHLKEKLQFVQGENQEQSKTLKNVEACLAQSRDVLTRTKQGRDGLRIDNQRLRQNCGLLGNEPLLRDFEERKDEGDDLRDKLEELRMRHAELTLHCNQVRRKIEQARQTMA